ncbi:hypothetical protein TOC8172_29000 [Pseudomonas syringae]
MLLGRHAPAAQDALRQLSWDTIGDFTVTADILRAEDDPHDVRGAQDLREIKLHIKA